jgi:hypothetical protein
MLRAAFLLNALGVFLNGSDGKGIPELLPY